MWPKNVPLSRWEALVPGDADHSTLRSIVLASPVLSAILRDWPVIGLPHGWLVAGAVAQTVWNSVFGFPADHGIKDADIIYFDRSDLTESAEERHAERIRRRFAHLPVTIDVKNEARVHLWYEAKFGKPIAPYRSAAHAISTFPTTATSIGIRSTSSGLAIEAPYGLADLFALVVRPNRMLITREVYEQKIARWRLLWPDLRIFPWETA
jgi:uncharacterized protein